MVKKERLVVAILVMVMLLSLGTATAQAAKYIVYDPSAGQLLRFSTQIVEVSQYELIYVLNADPNSYSSPHTVEWSGDGGHTFNNIEYGEYATITPGEHGIIYMMNGGLPGPHVEVFVKP